MKTRQSEIRQDRSMTDLIAAVRTGDQQAFAELYKLTSQEVYRTARAILRDEDTALDVQQDTYVFAYNHLDQLTEPEKVLPWLRTIAVNRAKTVLRRQSPILFTELENEEGEGLPEQADLSPEASPELSLERKETAELVNEILADLSDGQRAAVAMYYYEQMSVGEIAQALGVSASTVKNQLARGRKKIEEAVRALEKQGVKIYGLTPVPFLLALMKGQSLTAKQGEVVLAKTMTEAGLVAGAKTAAAVGAKAAAAEAARPVAVHMGRSFFETAAGKLLVGILAAGLVGGCIWGGAKLLDREPQSIIPNQPTETVEAVLLQNSTEHAPTAAPEDRTEPAVSVTDPAETNPTETAPVVTDTTDSTAPTEPAEQYPYAGTCGKDLTWRFDPETGLLTIEGSGAMEDYTYNTLPWRDYSHAITAVSLPEELTKIGQCAFYDCDVLSSLLIPNSVKGIGQGAFMYCGSLSSVTIGSNVTSIGTNAFSGCSNLEAIQVVAGNQSYCSVDGVLFSKTKTELLQYPAGKQETTYAIPDGVMTIGAYAFYDCEMLRSISFPDGLERIGVQAFGECSALTSVTLPASVTSAGKGSFIRCSSLAAIQVAEDNSRYCSVDGVLLNKTKTELIQYPAGKPDPSYTIPDSVSQIDTSAFCYCVYLTSVTIGDSVTIIDHNAFLQCVVMTSVTISDSVKYIGNDALGKNWSDEAGGYMPLDGFTVYGSTGSAAQNYAEENGLAFVALDATGD